MAKAFSVASLNIEHLRNDPERSERVVEFLKEQRPDVLAIYEVEGKELFPDLVSRLPKHTFAITEGAQVQERQQQAVRRCDLSDFSRAGVSEKRRRVCRKRD